MRRMAVASAFLLLVGTITPAPGSAQASYPTRAVTIVVPYTAGGATSNVARLLADEMRGPLGQAVIVDHRPGAGGTIGTTFVARAQPDGYTLLLGALATHGVAPAVYTKLGYDPVKDFAAVAQVTISPFMVAIPATTPATNIKEFIAYARAHPDKIGFSSTGIGSASHLAGTLFASSGGFKATHVPYKGTPEAFGALFTGEVAYFVGNFQPLLPHVRAGKLRGLAVTGKQRSPALPDVPLIDETGHAAANVAPWFGVFAPARTPDAVVARLWKEISAALAKPEIRARLTASGDEPTPLGPDEFGALVKSEVPRWAKIVRAAGVDPN